MNMQMIAEIVENELKNAFEVKNEESLHRGISFLIDSIPHKEQNDGQHEQFREALLKMDAKTDRILLEMHEGFKRMDERFEANDKRFDDANKRFDDVNKRFDDVNKRFDDVNKRFDDNNRKFTMMFSFITIGFVMLATLMTAYQFLG
jgi:hypothetical protein